MKEKIKSMILELCRQKDNQVSDWTGHIESVVKHSIELAKKLNADEEVVELASWMHDIKKLRGEKEMHHVHGAEEAGEIMKSLGYPDDKIEKVKACILTHSSDKNYMPGSTEAKIVACADAMSHLDQSLALFFTAFKLRDYDIENAREWLKKKYGVAWFKLSLLPEAKEMAKEKYNAVMKVLENGL